MGNLFRAIRSLWLRVMTPLRLAIARRKVPLRVHYGCGSKRQSGYLNVDVRWTPAVDLLGDLRWCARNLRGLCSEVYMSHVLEHYGSPGKEWRDGPDTVLEALRDAHRMLAREGVLRIAVPDFSALASLYVAGELPMHPSLLGRLCGEQSYPENLHRCAFDKAFLEECLSRSGFGAFETWIPEECGLARDASFDQIKGTRTSLNLIARKIES